MVISIYPASFYTISIILVYMEKTTLFSYDIQAKPLYLGGRIKLSWKVLLNTDSFGRFRKATRNVKIPPMQPAIIITVRPYLCRAIHPDNNNGTIEPAGHNIVQPTL